MINGENVLRLSNGMTTSFSEYISEPDNLFSAKRPHQSCTKYIFFHNSTNESSDRKGSRDIIYSGEDRPAFLRLLHDIYNGSVVYIKIWKK